MPHYRPVPERRTGSGSASCGPAPGSAGQVADHGVAVADGLAEAEAHRAGRVVLTRRGRLLADAVIRDLTG